MLMILLSFCGRAELMAWRVKLLKNVRIRVFSLFFLMMSMNSCNARMYYLSASLMNSASAITFKTDTSFVII